MEFALGLDRQLAADTGLKGFYIGKVVDDGANDPQGRIKVRIESLFGKESDKSHQTADADLPWIQMMPSCGMYVRPQKGDFVTVVFQGTIYEGFYVGHTVSSKSKVFDANLGDEFVLNFHNSHIKGKYDGSKFEISVNNGKSKIEMNALGDITINGAGSVDIKQGVKITMNGVVIPEGKGPFCAAPWCYMTGAPQAGTAVLNGGV